MKLIINNIEFDEFNNIDVELNFGKIASAFSIDVLYDADNALHRQVFKPASYSKVELYNDDAELLITGTWLINYFKSNANGCWASLSGYSLTGVLEDCGVPLSAYPLQTNGLTLLQIVERLCEEFSINVEVDVAVNSRVNEVLTKTTANEQQSVKSYLAELCAHQQVVLTHTNTGSLLLTEANTTQKAVYNFEGLSKEYEMSLEFNGQYMHSELVMMRQAYKKDGGGMTGQTKIINPYVNVFRPSINRQVSGDGQFNTQNAVRNALSDELRGIVLNISIESFYLNEKFVKPGMLVSVKNKDLYLNNNTIFFIESVRYRQNERETKATLVCYVPEVYNQESPKNIFQ